MIEFKNGQAPYLSAENLNKMQKTEVISEENKNLNDFREDGKYFFNSEVSPINAPESELGWLEVFTSDNAIVKQVWYTDNKIYTRTSSEELWSDWVSNFEEYNNASKLFNIDNIKTITPIAGNNYAGFGGCYYYKTGTKVVLHIGIKMPSAVRAKIFTMPEGFRPNGMVCAWGGGADGNVPDQSFMELTQTGDIYVKSATTYALIVAEYDAFN